MTKDDGQGRWERLRGGLLEGLRGLWQREPARVVSAVVSIAAIFGLNVSDADAAVVIGALLLVIGGGETIRHQVTSPASVAHERDDVQAVLEVEGVPELVRDRVRTIVES